jgi:hypothetical protein
MKPLRTVVVVAALTTLASTLPASASTPPVFQSAKEATLPSGAKGLYQGYLPTLSCVSAGNCVAGGGYNNAKGDETGLILTETKGVWKAPTSLKAPSGAAASPGLTIEGLSCGAIGNCAAVGDYQDQAGNIEGFVANEVGNVWRVATTLALPANALVTGQDAYVRSVICSSSGNCSAVGGYLDNDATASRNVGFDVTETNGTWQRAAEITFATATNFNPSVTMSQLACSSTGNCSGVGDFIDVNDVSQGFVIAQVRGVWTEATTVTLPANASAFAGVTLSEDACAKTSCAVLGTYFTSTGALEALSASESNGTWRRAIELTMPSNAASNPHVFLYGFQGISCASAGNCATGGQYRDTSGNYDGFLVSEVNGTWTSAVQLSLPAGGQSAGANGGVVAMSCPSAGNCRAGAAYLDGSGNYQALAVTESNGAWLKGVKVALPSGATTVGVDGGIYSVVCSSISACTAVGSYLQTTTLYEGFTLIS